MTAEETEQNLHCCYVELLHFWAQLDFQLRRKKQTLDTVHYGRNK
jgi:hypothetical protein